jgi:hypothetical protein
MRSACALASDSSRSASAREWFSIESASALAVATIEDVLRIVEFAGDGVLDVVDQLEHVAAWHHTACRHRNTARFFDDRAKLVESLKYSVHGTPSRRSCCY